MSKRKIFFYSLLFTLGCGLIYLYVWEKPKLEKFIEDTAESYAKDHLPFPIDFESVKISIIPLQLEAYNARVTEIGKLNNISDPVKFNKLPKIEKITLRPSLLDILIGKYWFSRLSIEGSEIDIDIKKSETSKNNSDLNLKFDLDKILKKLILSQLLVKNIKLNLNYGDDFRVTTDDLFIKAYNEKSSLILTVKDPNLGIKTIKDGDFLNILTDFQVMVTRNTISVSKIKLVKDTSFFLASGNILYRNSPDNITEMNVNTRINTSFEDLAKWSNVVHKNTYFEKLKGKIKTDINFQQKSKAKGISTIIDGEFNEIQMGKLKLGNFTVLAKAPSKNQVMIEEIKAQLVGNNQLILSEVKINVGDKTDISANLNIDNAQLHSFLRDSGIADIPVWLKVDGQMKCSGVYEKTLKIDCPGALTVKDLRIKTKGRDKTIVAAKKIDVAGSMTVTDSNISYKAKAKLGKTTGESTGVIDFEKGFDIKYKSDLLDLSEVGPIADLKFLGIAKTQGSTSGNSNAAVFAMDIEAENFEFENYFFGSLKTNLKYKSGSLYFDPIEGSIESTRYKGNLQVNLINEKILGDIQLPFFRMTDIQSAIVKKVDLQERFLGSGSGRILLNTPFDIAQLNFSLDARLFKGQAFGEDYNEARIKAEAVDGIIIIQEGKLQKETTEFLVRGTIDTELESKLSFVVNQGFLQLSSRIKDYNIPISGEFSAQGEIFGPLASPTIKTSANIKSLIFNKKKYDDAIFSYDNSNRQTNLQFNIPKNLELLVLLPESNLESVFVNLNANEFDVAPILGFAVSEEATRSYMIHTSGELSGKFDTKEFWNSEFSSTIRNVKFEYKSNKMETTIPTNIELKNGQLFLNEISFIGNRQHIKVNQAYTEKFRTKFIINSRINIAFFKIFAPFIEKVDGYSTLRLELSLNHHDFKLIGSSYTTDSFLKFPGFPHAFENLSADVLFNQNRVLINSISGELAGGKVIGSGEVKFPGGKNFDLFINTSMENVTMNFPAGFRTTGNGNISLSGSQPPFLLAGEYNVFEGLIDSNFDQGGSSENTDLLQELLAKEITSPLIINLDISTKNPVEIRNNLVEGYILGDIKVYDKINGPRIKGEAHFDENAVIRFRDQEFEVTSSSFLFEGENPINPKLSLRSQTRMNGYDIELFLQGRASKPILSWSSQPPLPESQIVSMLALGTLPDQFDQTNNASGNGDTQGFEVGTSLLSNNPLGKELKERYDVDVQFSSSFDDQNNAAVPKVTLRRKVSKKLQVSVSATTGNTNQQEGRVTYELNNDISTIFRIANQPDDGTNNNTNNQNNVRQSNPFGVDLEYRVEFD